MGVKSDIAWLYDPRTGKKGATWNPLRGCTKASPGCTHCFAEGIARRFCGPGLPYEGVATEKGWTGDVVLVKKHLCDPLRWHQPKLIFVNSMADLFHPKVPFEWNDLIAAIIALTPQHTHLSLTKRAERQFEYMTKMRVEGPSRGHIALHYGRPARAFPEFFKRLPLNNDAPLPWPIPNWWVGITAEDDTRLEERLPHLKATPAAVRWVSYEPAIGPVYLDAEILKGVDWFVIGAESGPRRRPMELAWARCVVRDCAKFGVPVFVKQLDINGTVTDDVAQFPEDLRIRQRPGDSGSGSAGREPV